MEPNGENLDPQRSVPALDPLAVGPLATHSRNFSAGETTFTKAKPGATLGGLEGALQEDSPYAEVTCVTQNSDEMLAIKQPMAPTTQRPASASFAAQQQCVRRLGSFVSSTVSADRPQYEDRVRVHLVFKHEKLEALAKSNLRSYTLMALQHLSVDEFLREVMRAMKVPPLRKHTKMSIGFHGRSALFPVYFDGSELIEKVFRKICSIEEAREISLNSSNEDFSKLLPATSGTSASEPSQREQSPQPEAKAPAKARPILIAEIDMHKVELSEGQERVRSQKRRSSRSGSNGSGSTRQKRHPRSRSSKSNESASGSSCQIF